MHQDIRQEKKKKHCFPSYLLLLTPQVLPSTAATLINFRRKDILKPVGIPLRCKTFKIHLFLATLPTQTAAHPAGTGIRSVAQLDRARLVQDHPSFQRPFLLFSFYQRSPDCYSHALQCKPSCWVYWPGCLPIQGHLETPRQN